MKKLKILLLTVDTIENGLFKDKTIFENKTDEEIFIIANSLSKTFLKVGEDNIKDIPVLENMGIEIDVDQDGSNTLKNFFKSKTKRMRFVVLPQETLDNGILDDISIIKEKTSDQVFEILNSISRLTLNVGTRNVKSLVNLSKQGKNPALVIDPKILEYLNF